MLVRTTIDTPLGPFTVFSGDAGVVRTIFGEEEPVEIDPDVSEDRRRAASIRREVDAYFLGTLRVFETPADLSGLGDGFARRVLETVTTIPYGQMWTYGDVAGGGGGGARAPPPPARRAPRSRAAQSSCSSPATASSEPAPVSGATGATTTVGGSCSASRGLSPTVRPAREKVASDDPATSPDPDARPPHRVRLVHDRRERP